MTRWVVLGTISLLASGCNCSPRRLSSAQGDGRAQNVDMGTVPLGQLKQAPVVLSNDGTAPLSIRSASISGPAAADYQLSKRFPAQLEIGASASGQISFTPSAAGPRAAVLTLVTDSARTPSVTVQLSGMGIDLSFSLDPNPADFGQVQVGAPAASLTLTLTNDGNGSLSAQLGNVTGPQASDFSVGAPMGSLDPGGAMTVTLSYQPAVSGASSATLPIEICAAGNGCGSVTVVLQGQAVDSQLLFVPSPVTFGAVAAGSTGQVTVTMVNSGTADITVQSLGTVSGSSAVFQILGLPNAPPFDLPAGGSVPFTVQYSPSGGAGDADSVTASYQVSGVLTRTANDAFLGNGVLSPCALTLSAMSLDFGLVVAGQTASQALALTNNGQTTCQVSSVAIAAASDPAYSLAAGTPTMLTVAPGGNAALTVDFLLASATLPPIRRGTLQFNTSDPNQPMATVPMTAALNTSAYPCTLTVSPASLNYGTSLGANVPATLAVTVTNTSPAASCNVSGIQLSPASDPDFALASATPTSLTLAAGASGTIGVVFDAPNLNPPSLHTGDLLFTTTDASQPSIDVPLTAQTQNLPCALTVSPASLNFGTLGANTPTTLTVSVTNTSPSGCSVTGIHLSSTTNPDFTLASPTTTSLTIAAGTSRSIGVVFDAPNLIPPSTHKGDLLFATTDATQPSVDVPLVAQTSPYAGGGAWPRWHHDNTQSGLSSVDTSALTGTIQWTANVGAPPPPSGQVHDYMNSPVVGTDGTIYQVGWAGDLYAFNPDGGTQWTTHLQGPLSDPHPSTPIIASDNSIFVAFGEAAGSNSFFQVSKTGAILAQIPAATASGDGFDLPPILTNGGFLLGADDITGAFAYSIAPGSVFTLVDPRSGTFTGAGDPISAVVGPDDTSYYCQGGFSCISVTSPDAGFVLNPAWGTTGLTIPTGASGSYTSDLAFDVAFTGNIFIVFGGWWSGQTTGSQILASVNPANGAINWTRTLPPPTSAQSTAYPTYVFEANSTTGNSCPAIGPDGTIYVGNFDGLHAVAGATGAEKPGFPFLTPGDVLTAPAVGSDGTIFFGTDDGSFYAIHPTGTLRFKVTAGGRVAASPAIGPFGNVYFVADDGSLYAVN